LGVTASELATVPRKSGVEIRPFSKATFRFLTELEAKNERPWFQANKSRYERAVVEPALAFIGAMAPRLDRISKHFLAVPKRTGGSLMRIYRDTRFAYNKTPYKTNVGIQFRHEVGRDVHAPGFYVHIEPDSCFLGAGIWRPETEPLRAIRERIVAEPDLWHRVATDRRFTAEFALTGDRLERPPRGFSAASPHVDDLKRKDFTAISRLTHSDILRRDLPELVAARFKAAAPLMAFLCAALDLEY
jgi:uncharacterized protein (TIGR02453 family)